MTSTPAASSLRQSVPAEACTPADDPYLWLEDITGDEALAWVRARNAETGRELEAWPGYQALEDGILAILDSEAKIPYVAKAGPWYYNLWRDAAHPRGLWRRTSLEEYRKDDPAWEVVLDLDALGRSEGESWVFHGARFLRPGFERCLVMLSPGGSDAHVVREFDPLTREFVPGGFALPLAKSTVGWIDRDTLFVATDFGPGSLTTSGYPRVVRIWQRGTPLGAARAVFEGRPEDLGVEAYHDPTPGFERDFVVRRPSFFTEEMHLLGPDGTLTRVDLPADAEAGVRREWLLVRLRSAWTAAGRRYPAGALLAVRFEAFLAGERRFTVLFRPGRGRSLESWDWTRNHLILDLLDHVKTRLFLLTPGPGRWTRRPLPGAPALGTASASGVDPYESDEFFLNVNGYLAPDTLYLGGPGREPEPLKRAPAWFDAAGLEVTQHFAVSRDGTRIPYFQVARAGLALDGSHPTLLNGYGGFEVSLVPRYSGVLGRAWLERGGVFAVANIRGGGEYGPRWHQAALKRNRHRAFEDFAAVARDLAARGVTSPRRLGIEGGSNGGLLVGNLLIREPELVGAVVCQVPLLDMERYSRLLAGASWMEEYGDPERPEDWAWLRAYSPYHNVRADRAYPPVLFMTTTRDDRVHPAHARKMAARMLAQGHDVRYFENLEGGHGAGADNRQAARYWALQYAFLVRTLMDVTSG
ncbi:MAG: prolyl oligopeptidase family serine peptidase [Holophaga sp.]|jgi:prolyl oligopeptidase